MSKFLIIVLQNTGTNMHDKYFGKFGIFKVIIRTSYKLKIEDVNINFI